MSSPIPLSVNLMPTAPVDELVELAVLAEALGCRRCWIYDEGLATRDVYITLSSIAAATDTILVGPGITNPFVRHPGATATAIATLDEVAQGRAFLGLGAGGGLTLAPMAIARRRPLTAVGDMVASLRSLFAGDAVDLDGEVFSFAGAQLPYARDDIEIILAGRGPRMIALAADVADGFYLSYVHKDTIGATVNRLRSGAGAQNRPFSITYSTMIATSDTELEQARAELSFRLVDSPPDIKARLGLTDSIVDKIRQALAGGGPRAAAAFVDPDWVSQFVLCGTPASISAEIHDLLSSLEIDEFQLAVSDIDRGAELIERTAAMFGQDSSR